MSSEKNTDRFAVTGNVPAQSSMTTRRAKTAAERVMPPVVYRLPGNGHSEGAFELEIQ
jgi:hypothetical protein